MTKDEGISLGDQRYQRLRFEEWTSPGTQVYLSKAKLGIYSEYLGLYIRYWDRGHHESEWSGRERKYTIVREMSQKGDKREI